MGLLYLHCRHVAGAQLLRTRAFPSLLPSLAECLGVLRASLLQRGGVVWWECHPGKSKCWFIRYQAVRGEHGVCPGGGASHNTCCGMYRETLVKAGGSSIQGYWFVECPVKLGSILEEDWDLIFFSQREIVEASQGVQISWKSRGGAKEGVRGASRDCWCQPGLFSSLWRFLRKLGRCWRRHLKWAGLCPSAGSSSIPLCWYRGREDCHQVFPCPLAVPRPTWGAVVAVLHVRVLLAEPCLGSSGRTLSASFAVLGAMGPQGLCGERPGLPWAGSGQIRQSLVWGAAQFLRAAGGVRGKKGEKHREKERNERGKYEEQPCELWDGEKWRRRRGRGAPGAGAGTPRLLAQGCGMDGSRRNLHSPAPLKVGEGVGSEGGVSWMLEKRWGGGEVQ